MMLLLTDFCIDQNMKVTQILNIATKELDQSLDNGAINLWTDFCIDQNMKVT